MKALPLLLAIAMLSAGCIGRDPDAVTPAAVSEPPAQEGAAPAGEEPAASPTPAPAPAAPAASTNATTAAAPAANASEPTPAPRIEVIGWNGSYTGVGLSPPEGPVCCWWRSAEEGADSGSFDVTTPLKGIVLELAWTHEQFDLDLELYAPDWSVRATPDPTASQPVAEGHSYHATGGMPGQPDRVARIVVDDPAVLALTGTYAWRVGAEGVAQDAAYTVAVSLFYDTAPSADHTALASA